MATVLLVDDDPRLLDALEALVTLEGHRVVRAQDGKEALRCVHREHPTLIVTDYMMPVMDGAQLIKALAEDPELATVPVVLNTALPSPPEALRVAGYVSKPFAAARLVELLRRFTS
ncbi:Polar-differentiation response regulator DivK [Paraburkholderia phenoliruptrix]|nr:Polar-differentiation response regulator DivK [Paraburkholderia phenoliruptrix]